MNNAQDLIVSIDYIRLATWDFQTYVKLSANVRRKFIGWRKSRWLQYKMERSQENVSYGLGEQNKRPHGIFEASGVDAHIFASWLLNTQQDFLPSLYCSRIDLQATKQPPEGWNYLTAYKRLSNPKRIILDDTGSTLYIGNRESNTFWRIYDKAEDEVRVEIELKSTQARKCWTGIVGGNEPARVYEHYLRRSRLPSIIVKDYATGRDPVNEDELKDHVPPSLETSYLWFAGLDSLVYKLLNDHDTGDRTRELLKRWTEYGTKP